MAYKLSIRAALAPTLGSSYGIPETVKLYVLPQKAWGLLFLLAGRNNQFPAYMKNVTANIIGAS